jgi:hypothetical protein
MNILKKTGNPEQLAYLKRMAFQSGKADGVQGILCRNGRLSLTLLESMALDIYDLSFAGHNISFISKNGLVSRKLANTPAYDFARSVGGGFLFTCGLDNIGNAVDDKLVHGNFSSLPAVITRSQVHLEDAGIFLEVGAEICDTALFSKNILVSRNYKIFNDRIILKDIILNRGYKEEKIILMYHFNIGYPMLDTSARLSANIGSTECRTANCAAEKYNVMAEPADHCFEEVFIHTIDGDHAVIEVENPELKQKITFSYHTGYLKYLTEWKSMQSGDYALGIEPATSHLDRKEYLILKPSQNIENEITIGFSGI